MSNIGYSDKLVQEKKALDGRCATPTAVAAWAGMNGMVECGGDMFEPLPWELPKGKHAVWGAVDLKGAVRCSGLADGQFSEGSEELKKRGLVKDGPDGSPMVFLGFKVLPY